MMTKFEWMTKERFIDWAAVVAIVVGTCKVVGLLSGIWIFTRVGQTFAISPAPSPYDRVNTLDPNDVNFGLAFGCESLDHSVTWHRWNHVVRGAIPGPHRRGVTFLSYFGNIGRNRTDVDRRRFVNASQYYFCNGGPIANAAGCDPHISTVHFRDLPMGGAVREQVRCSP